MTAATQKITNWTVGKSCTGLAAYARTELGRFFDTTVSLATGQQLRPFAAYEARLDFSAESIVNEYGDKCLVSVFVFADKIEVQIYHPYGQLTEAHVLDASKDSVQFSIAVAETYDSFRSAFC